MKYSIAVVGLGNIGMGYDYNHSSDDYYLTHSNAANSHDDFHLIAGVDPDREKRAKFKKRYQKLSYPSVIELMEDLQPDVAIIAAPAKEHIEIFTELVKFKLLAIICEKPFGQNLIESKQMYEIAKKKDILLGVNYIRRFDPGIRELRDLLRNKEIGKIEKVITYYCNGLKNNASHFIDLMNYFFDNIEFKSVLSTGPILENDVEPDFLLSNEETDFYFLAIEGKHFNYFSVQLFGSEGMIIYDGNSNIEIRKSENDPIFLNSKQLSPESDFITTNHNQYQKNVLDSLSEKLKGKGEFLCDAKSALESLGIVDQIINEMGKIR